MKPNAAIKAWVRDVLERNPKTAPATVMALMRGTWGVELLRGWVARACKAARGETQVAWALGQSGTWHRVDVGAGALVNTACGLRFRSKSFAVYGDGNMGVWPHRCAQCEDAT